MSDKGKTRRLLSVGGGSSDPGKLLPPSIVTPVLRDVGKLAASVAAVNTYGNGEDGGKKGNNSGGSGSATGNPRNKCVLEPGHSLMDWIRLGNSGKDLTGVGVLAGKMTVTPEEMRLHNKRDDAWIAIRGNVYNVTEYLSFHPGGVTELMKGVGVADATTLFDNVHPWVNYDKMLTKCYVGRLGTAVSSELSKPSEFANVRFASPRGSETSDTEKQVSNRRYSIAINDDRHVRYDWIQKHDLFILYFYTGPYSNPFFEIRRPFDHKWTFVITFVESVFTFKFSPHDILEWPPRFKVFYETGKIEVGFEKHTKKTWPSCGHMEQNKRRVIGQQCKTKYMIQEHTTLNKYTYMISVQKTDLSICNTPLGYHLLFFNDSKDSREYTPIPHMYIKPDLIQQKETFTSPFITFLIRRYPDGRMSNYLFNKKVGDIFLGTEPMGSLDLQIISDKEYFIFLAGGVGIAPFLSILHFLLEKKVKPIRSMMLLLFNKTVEHQFFESKLQALGQDPRFHFFSIVTRPDEDYSGLSGHISPSILREFCRRYFHTTPMREVFYFICGPLAFNSGCFDTLSALKTDPTNTFFFSSESASPSQEQIASSMSNVENKE